MFRNVVSGLARQRTAFKTVAQRRNFGAGAPKKEWTGIGKIMKQRERATSRWRLYLPVSLSIKYCSQVLYLCWDACCCLCYVLTNTLYVHFSASISLLRFFVLPAPQFSRADKTVRDVFPEDHQCKPLLDDSAYRRCCCGWLIFGQIYF